MRIKLFVFPAESSDEKVFGDEDIAEKMEGCEGENPCQIHGKTDLQ